MSNNLEQVLAKHASPALFGIKPANLISISLFEIPNLVNELKDASVILGEEASFKILKMASKRALLLVYKKNKLIKTIYKKPAFNYLKKHGYPNIKDLDLYLSFLSNRINLDKFPHEIGVFLGYDLFDIIEFEKHNKNSIYVGYWTVYRDLDSKIKLFDKYNKCKNLVVNLLEKGYHLESIIKKEIYNG